MHAKMLNAGMLVRKEDVRFLLANIDPKDSQERKSRKLRCRQNHSKGPNYIWHVDSYDKLKPYGICINVCIDGYSRKIMWLHAYKTSSDSRVVGGYFWQKARTMGAVPTVVLADKGTENVLIRQMQRYIRRSGVP